VNLPGEIHARPLCSRAVLNWIFLFFIVSSVVVSAFNGTLPKVTEASLTAAKTSVDIALGLAGQMALWLGFMAILREAGLMRSISRALHPVMKRLFPDVPPEHPAMGAMIMNLAANMLGLANAATPFGLQAMTELNKLNKNPGIATNPMVLFLAINTSGVAVLPLGAIAVRHTLGSKDPAGIIIPTVLATMCSTVTAVLVCKLIENRAMFAPSRYAALAPVEPPVATGPSSTAMAEAEAAAKPVEAAHGWRATVEALVWGLVFAALGWSVYRMSHTQGPFETMRSVLSDWLLPLLMLSIVIFGFGRRVNVYDVFVKAAKDGFQTVVTIIPYLVAILVAIAMFRASGAMDAIIRLIRPVTSAVGFPPEALPMALIRPLSGSGAMAVMTETMKQYHPDSFVGYMVSVINGSMETTFYVLAVYFGAVQVRETRHAIIPCLSADLAGLVGALVLCRLFFAGAP
jgi:spore maturation protein SpmA